LPAFVGYQIRAADGSEEFLSKPEEAKGYMRLAFISDNFGAMFTALAAVWMIPAYIDPNTGGLLFQLLAILFAIFSGVILIFSRYIKIATARFKRFLREILRRQAGG
jgi:ATP/ADP translocase